MKIAILLYPGFTALDAIGPYHSVAGVPGADFAFVAEQAGPVGNGGSFTMMATRSIDEIDALDVLLVPGGLAAITMAEEGGPLVDWIRAIHRTTTWTTSVCTGSLLLGAAGVLEGVRATTHWYCMDDLVRYGAIPTQERVVEHGKVMTAAGVSAGIDMGLRLLERIERKVADHDVVVALRGRVLEEKDRMPVPQQRSDDVVHEGHGHAEPDQRTTGGAVAEHRSAGRDHRSSVAELTECRAGLVPRAPAGHDDRNARRLGGRHGRHVARRHAAARVEERAVEIEDQERAGRMHVGQCSSAARIRPATGDRSIRRTAAPRGGPQEDHAHGGLLARPGLQDGPEVVHQRSIGGGGT